MNGEAPQAARVGSLIVLAGLTIATIFTVVWWAKAEPDSRAPASGEVVLAHAAGLSSTAGRDERRRIERLDRSARRAQPSALVSRRAELGQTATGWS